MTNEDLNHYRQLLLDLGRRLQRNFSSLESDALQGTGGNLSNMPIHTADLDADNYDQQVAMSLLESEDERLEAIVAALRYIEDGTYGHCQECTREIAAERLAAVPYAELCIGCASASRTSRASQVAGRAVCMKGDRSGPV